MQLEEIIRVECLPLRDCMLTVADDNGEAGFLYFKDGELIEANYAALWGKEAMAQILEWIIAEHMVAPLPLGIKRSLWDKLEQLLNPGMAPTPSGKLPAITPAKFNAPGRKTAVMPYDPFKRIPNVFRLIHFEDGGKGVIVYEAPNQTEAPEDTAWLNEFAAQARSVGDSLGFGNCQKWVITTEKYEVVGLKLTQTFLAALRRPEGNAEDLETDIDLVLREET